MNKSNNNFWASVYGDKIKSRTYYSLYGKVLRIKPKTILKKAFTFDVIAPLTFGIPTLAGLILLIATLGKELTIDRGKR